MSEDPRELLAQAVADRGDDEIIAFVGDLGGTEGFLDAIFDGMAGALDRDRAVDCVIGWEIADGETVHAYTVRVAGGAAEATKAAAPDARVTLGLSVADFLRLIAGHLDGMQAFMQGRLRLTGDMMFAAQIQDMFSTR